MKRISFKGVCNAVAIAAITTASLGFGSAAIAEDEAKKLPTDFRRTTLLVSDMDASLEFYRDILGFKVNYDTELEMSGQALPAGQPGAMARLVILASNDPYIGGIGMLEWLDPPLEPRKELPTRLGIGDAALIFNTVNLEDACGAAQKLEGFNMTRDITEARYPGRNGGPEIVVNTCYMFDRDGYFLELNRVEDPETLKLD